MADSRGARLWSGSLLLVVLILFAAPRGWGEELPDFSTDPADRILAYQRFSGEAPGGRQEVAIYRDGRVVVRRPHYMKRSGTYELRLSPTEKTALVKFVIDQGVLAFDQPAVEEERRRAARAEARVGRVFDVADGDWTILEARLDGVEKRISWQGLQGDGEWFSGIQALQGLAKVERRLLDLTRRDDLRKID